MSRQSHRSFLLGSLIFVSLLNIRTAFSQNTTPAELPSFTEITTLFQYLEQFDQIIIKTDLDSLVQNKNRAEKQDAYVTVSGNEIDPIQFKVTIKARGKFRRRTCGIPPVKLNFKKKDLKKLGLFPDYDILKLATSCYEEPDRDQKLLKEYWAYEMYNQLTPESFEVHPLQLTYIDIKDTTRTIQMQSFFIENEEEMAHRLNSQVVNRLGTVDTALEAASYYRTVLFNYMIGNTDWDILMARNVNLLQAKGSDKYTVVPYDFDFSAFVSPSYFYLIHSRNPRQIPSNRIVLGTITDLEAFRLVCQYFLDNEKSGLQCYTQCSMLAASTKKSIQKYLQPFFKLLKKERRIKRVFLTK